MYYRRAWLVAGERHKGGSHKPGTRKYVELYLALAYFSSCPLLAMGRRKPSLLDEPPQPLFPPSVSMTRPRRAVFLCSLFFFAFVVYNRPYPEGTRGSPSYDPSLDRNPSFLVRARHGAVAAENKRCSDIGVDVLKEGGNAVDAAIATTFCIGVVNMFS
jgi:hypothetical protein